MAVRSSTSQLCLLVLTLLAVGVWFRGSLDHRTRYHVLESPAHDLEGTTEDPPSDSLCSSHHLVRPDGLVETNLTCKHPVWDLIADAERQWEKMNGRQSATLAQAVSEYKRRNGYPPPAGFDLWWDFARIRNVRLVDEFDQINYDIMPYLALSPRKFRERVEELADPNIGHHLNITDGNLGFYGPRWAEGNQRQLPSMMGGFSRALPDLLVHGHRQLRGDAWIGEDLRRAAQMKVRAGEYFSDEELQHFESLARNSHRDRKNACLPDDPIFNTSYNSDAPTFIASHLTSMSPCSNSLVHDTPPILFAQTATPPRLTPYFVFSKHRPDSGFLLPSNMWEYYDPLLEEPHAWAERFGDRLFWRGPPTGWAWSKRMASGLSWRDGGRAKFVLEFGQNVARGQEEVAVLLENATSGTLMTKMFDRAFLNEKWLDVGLSGSPIQCNEEDGTCDEMLQAPIWKETYDAHKSSRRKFVVDLDSNSWSEEFQRKLSWGNVVFKATTYPEWNTQWLIPYYHYIPIKTDYSDVYNIMAFFRGDPETGIGGHADVAAKISQHASTFSRENWRWEDMQTYLYRLMLEYVRLGQDDREAASFQL